MSDEAAWIDPDSIECALCGDTGDVYDSCGCCQWCCECEPHWREGDET